MSTSTINCPFCGKLTDRELDACVHCGGFFRSGTETGTGARGRSQTCPNCGALVQEGDIICVACGTNLLTGQKIAEETQSAAPAQSRNWKPIGIGVAAVAAVLVIGLGIGLLLRDPVARAERLHRAGQRIEALELLQNTVDRAPDNARAHFLIGRLRSERNEFTQAAEAFETAARLEPTNADAFLLAATSYADSDAGGAQNRALASLRRLVEAHPDHAEGWYLLAQAHGAAGDTTAQIEALRQYADLAPDDGRAAKALAIAETLEGDYQAAAQSIERAQRLLDEDDPDLTAAAGILAGLQGNDADAFLHLRAALDAGTTLEKQALTQLGLLLLADGSVREAEDYIRQARELDRDDPALRFFYALCLAEQGLHREAFDEFSALARGTGRLAAQASVEEARVALRLNEVSTAADAAERAVQAGIDDPALHTIRGRIFMRMGERTRARDAFRRAIQIDPGYAPARLENGLQYVQRNLLREGIAELRAYLDLVDPALPDARTEEIAALIEQLEQTMDDDSRPTGGVASRAASRSVQ